ncbi:hypothetical protein ACFV83_29760 [Streptomyces pharetrae]|uniref:hypothetical protein n=1 Tax=Streptomyces pharetrae TaxID=291370 RepID=UPI0036597B5D
MPDAPVRLRWSAPPEDRLALSRACVRTERRAVLCRVGPVPVDGLGERSPLRVGLRGAPSEVLMECDAVGSRTPGTPTASGRLRPLLGRGCA